MIPLNIETKKNFVSMSYKSDSDYFKIHDDLEDEFFKQLKSTTEIALFLQDHPKEKNSVYMSEVRKPAHRNYFWSLEYSLRELLNHFKSIVQIYGDYLITDYYFHGIFLTDEDLHMHHCQFGADDEEFEDWEMNCHLLGKTLNDFVEHLDHQRQLGDIRIKAIKIILLHNKATKTKKRKRTHIPKGMRHEVFKRDNYTCCECGARKDDGARLHVDHIIPVSKGGSDELDNLQTLCSDCNLNKSDVIQSGK